MDVCLSEQHWPYKPQCSFSGQRSRMLANSTNIGNELSRHLVVSWGGLFRCWGPTSKVSLTLNSDLEPTAPSYLDCSSMLRGAMLSFLSRSSGAQVFCTPPFIRSEGLGLCKSYYCLGPACSKIFRDPHHLNHTKAFISRNCCNRKSTICSKGVMACLSTLMQHVRV